MSQSPAILVIDDDDIVRTVMELELQDRGCTVYCASNGAEALDLLKQHVFAAAVVDLNMPGLSGHSLMTVLRADHPRLPIVATSGAEPTEPLPEGAIFILKPHRPGQLHAAVQVSLLTDQYGLR